MTMPLSLNPGCFASVLAAQASCVTCQACSVREPCFAAAAAAEPAIIGSVRSKLEARGQDGFQKVVHYLRNRKSVSVTAAKSGNARADLLLKRFTDERIDLAGIKRGVNPFPLQTHPLYHHMAAFLLQRVPFRPKDMTEYVQAHYDSGLKTGSLKSEVARFSSTLVAAKILDRKDCYILCLST